MPAASYREGPDGHSSRKQNSKRRRAKCSPSFVSGRVIGHGDIPPRCVPECSAMALHRAVPRCSSQPRQHSVIADSASCGDSIHVATAPLIRQAELAQREGYLPYLWRLSSVFLADAIGL